MKRLSIQQQGKILAVTCAGISAIIVTVASWLFSVGWVRQGILWAAAAIMWIVLTGVILRTLKCNRTRP